MCLHICLSGMFIRNMRSCLVVLLLVQVSFASSAQNKWLRMQPEDWFELESVQKAWRMVKQDTGAYWSNAVFDQGWLSLVAGSEGAMFIRGKDLRLVFDSAGHNLSKSHNLGFNNGAKEFFWNGRCYAVGGQGYWNYHSQLIEFVATTGEWELQHTDFAPDFIDNKSTCWDANNGRIISIDETALESEDGALVRGVYAMPMDGGWSWELKGQVNPALLNHLSFPRLQSFDLKDFFIWVGLHKTLILRKEDMSCVLSDALNEALLNGSSGKNRRLPSSYRHTSTKNGILTRRNLFENSSENQEWSWDIAKAFEDSEGMSMPLAVPVSFRRASASDGNDDNSNMLGSLVLALMLGGVGFYLGKSRQKPMPAGAPGETASIEKDDNKATGIQNSEVGQARLSALTQEFLDLEASSLDTIQLNALLALTDDLSEETKRARRAQAIRKVNVEYELLYQQALIVRTKDKLDRRRTIYIIQRHSDSA